MLVYGTVTVTVNAPLLVSLRAVLLLDGPFLTLRLIDLVVRSQRTMGVAAPDIIVALRLVAVFCTVIDDGVLVPYQHLKIVDRGVVLVFNTLVGMVF